MKRLQEINHPNQRNQRMDSHFAKKHEAKFLYSKLKNGRTVYIYQRPDGKKFTNKWSPEERAEIIADFEPLIKAEKEAMKLIKAEKKAMKLIKAEKEDANEFSESEEEEEEEKPIKKPIKKPIAKPEVEEKPIVKRWTHLKKPEVE